MNNIFKKSTVRFLVICCFGFLLFQSNAYSVGAQATEPAPPDDKPFGFFLKLVGGEAGYRTEGEDVDETFFITVLGTITAALLSLLGIIFLSLTIYGGFRWMLARGNEDEVNKSKSIIRHSLTGLIVVLSSYAIWRFIAEFLF